jgi:hypothetical protein
MEKKIEENIKQIEKTEKHITKELKENRIDAVINAVIDAINFYNKT